MPQPHPKGHPWHSPLPGQTTRHRGLSQADPTDPNQLRALTDRAVALRVRCAICTAQPGHECTTDKNTTTDPHRGRIRVGRREANALADRLEAARP